MEMKLISVNTGLPREVTWHGRHVTTAIFKQPVEGRVALTTLNLDGDRQADLSVHGGEDKAVYCYPIEHYDYWRSALPGRELPLGSFGENFTVEGDDPTGWKAAHEFIGMWKDAPARSSASLSEDHDRVIYRRK